MENHKNEYKKFIKAHIFLFFIIIILLVSFFLLSRKILYIELKYKEMNRTDFEGMLEYIMLYFLVPVIIISIAGQIMHYIDGINKYRESIKKIKKVIFLEIIIYTILVVFAIINLLKSFMIIYN